ncbi:MAG TPA: Hsp33 family molecular chaperone HslO [Polyangia bacterium]
MTHTQKSPSASDDLLLRALLPSHSLRLVAAITTGVAREAASRHGAVGGPAIALARGATAGLLLATLTKDRERMTAEVNGGGAFGPLMIDSNGGGDVRVYLRHPGTPVPASAGSHVSIGKAMGHKGIVRVVRDLGLRETVSGQTPVLDGEIDTDLEHYLCTSEQIPSVLGCEALLGRDLEITMSGGLLLQTLPGSDALPVLEHLRREIRGGALTRALGAMSAHHTSPVMLAHALLGEFGDDLMELDIKPVRFFCPCSKERALNTLSVLSVQDLAEMVSEGKGAEITCEFCRAHHLLSPDDVERAHADARASRPS